jgi:CRISPR-associated protein Cas2
MRNFDMQSWLIGYDITDPKRLQRIYRIMLRYATPLEYSIFLFTGTEQEKIRCIDELLAIIDVNSDDLRCYPLPEHGVRERIGKATLPDGILLSFLPGTL